MHRSSAPIDTTHLIHCILKNKQMYVDRIITNEIKQVAENGRHPRPKQVVPWFSLLSSWLFVLMVGLILLCRYMKHLLVLLLIYYCQALCGQEKEECRWNFQLWKSELSRLGSEAKGCMQLYLGYVGRKSERFYVDSWFHASVADVNKGA